MSACRSRRAVGSSRRRGHRPGYDGRKRRRRGWNAPPTHNVLSCLTRPVPQPVATGRIQSGTGREAEQGQGRRFEPGESHQFGRAHSRLVFVCAKIEEFLHCECRTCFNIGKNACCKFGLFDSMFHLY